MLEGWNLGEEFNLGFGKGAPGAPIRNEEGTLAKSAKNAKKGEEERRGRELGMGERHKGTQAHRFIVILIMIEIPWGMDRR